MVTFYHHCNITWLLIKIKKGFGLNDITFYFMRILYDHQIFSIQKYGGISKYFCELMKNLPPETEYNLSLFFSDNQYLKEDYKLF